MNHQIKQPKGSTDPVIPSDILQKSLSAGHWFFLDVVMQKVLIFGSFFITARLLTPEDFGIIALAMIYPHLLDSLTAIAFDLAITQKKDGEEKPYLNAVWTFNLLRLGLVFCVVFLSATFAADFFNASHAVFLFQLSTLPLLFQAMSNIGQIYFFRNIDLKKVFIRDMFHYGTAAVVSIVGAILLHSYWALFIGSVSGIFVAAVSTYFLSSYRPRVDFKLQKLRPLLKYSEWVFGQGIVTRIAQTLEDTLVGHFTNATSVGFYSKAKSLAYAPTSPLGNIISKIGFSAIVAVQDSLSRVREGFYKSFDLATAVALPFVAAIWIAGDRLVLIVLGPTWLGITPLLGILVVVAALNSSILNISTAMLNALGKPQLVFRLNMLSLVCAVIFLPLLVVQNGIQGAATAILLTSIAVNTYSLFLINKIIDPSWIRLGGSAAVTLFAASLPLLFTPLLLKFELTNTTWGFLLIGVLMGILYISTILFFGKFFQKGPYGTLLIILQSFHKRGQK